MEGIDTDFTNHIFCDNEKSVGGKVSHKTPYEFRNQELEDEAA